MSLIEEYLECLDKYTIIERTISDDLFKQLNTQLNFHYGGRINSHQNMNCIEYYTIDAFKEYIINSNILGNEKVILLPSIYDVPTIRTSLNHFYNCFYDCLAACSDVWMIFENYDLVVEFNHDDEIIVCQNVSLKMTL